MKEDMRGERILYPCYFDSALARSEGRRVPRSLGVKSPTLVDLEKAAKKCRLQYRIEQKPHPAHWTRREGRLVVVWSEGKEALIRRIARCIEGKR
ncbi:MAG: signal recognition particle subunit SRP19/SEC65 family protein [Methanomicrobiales archaeon]|nr:signal recognition particle subunit SRP19/SEC65 family protein [Methanomicrobiales archaeon]MDI6876150.1 signal recognition particle subunit SRP19/SEC65 family protein [Methanomicrobiales archaeon]